MADTDTEHMRIRYGFWILVVGMAVILLVLLISLWKWTDVKDVTAILGTIGGMVGTLAGAFFGVHVGAVGKERAENERQAAEQKLQIRQEQLTRMAAMLEPSQAARVLNTEGN